jgi:hypothetical protein
VTCQHCGSASGYFTKGWVCGSIRTYFNADGTTGDNAEMYSYLRHDEGKYAYCCDCEKRMFAIENK